MFRCRADASDLPREAGTRKQQLQQVQEAVSEMKQELKDHQRRVKHLQSEGFLTVNSSVIGRLLALEVRHSEVSTLLHVHGALMHELQTQLQNLSRILRSMCKPVLMRTSAPISITRPAVPVVSSCPSDCASLIQNGVHRSGIYSVVLAPGVSLPVYCDMETDGGGWTVFQRRRDGSVNFNRGWDEYSAGFGDLRSEHWLGNTPLHLLVTQRHCSLRIHLLDWTHVHHHALYEQFSIESEQGRFRLHVSGFSGSVSDSFGWYHDGQDFGTPDSGHLCAEVCHSGWWFRHCYQANLNGVYYQGGLYSLRAQNLLGPDGLVWFSWRDSDFYSLKATTMMIRPREFRTHRSP
uniref:Fibrinogen C-terminal domain-containing protein n=1 Tax=Neogobius melanostomus TaxID=47308 RepID=A0A8C6T4E2_9GOBI